MFRVAVQAEGQVFTWRDTFDGVDEARAAASEAGEEFPGAVVDVQEFVVLRGRSGWQSVDAPAVRSRWWHRFTRG